MALLLYVIINLFYYVLAESRCVITVSTPAVWLARENIKRQPPSPCINIEYSHGVGYMEYTTYYIE